LALLKADLGGALVFRGLLLPSNKSWRFETTQPPVTNKSQEMVGKTWRKKRRRHTHTHTQNGDMLAQWMRKIIPKRETGGLCGPYMLVFASNFFWCWLTWLANKVLETVIGLMEIHGTPPCLIRNFVYSAEEMMMSQGPYMEHFAHTLW